MSSLISATPKTPCTSTLRVSAAIAMASATWSTWIGGIVRAFATDSSGEDATGVCGAGGGGNADPRARRKPEGVGRPGGTLRWTVADKSSKAAIGDVSGRKWGW